MASPSPPIFDEGPIRNLVTHASREQSFLSSSTPPLPNLRVAKKFPSHNQNLLRQNSLGHFIILCINLFAFPFTENSSYTVCLACHICSSSPRLGPNLAILVPVAVLLAPLRCQTNRTFTSFRGEKSIAIVSYIPIATT